MAAKARIDNDGTVEIDRGDGWAASRCILHPREVCAAACMALVETDEHIKAQCQGDGYLFEKETEE